MEERREFLVEVGGERVDRYLAARLELSRSQIQALIRQSLVTVGGTKVKPSYLLSRGELIEVHLPPPEEALLPQEIPLNILYEDDDLAVVNKPAGMVVHPSLGHKKGTLLNALLARYPHLSQVDSPRPGIVHRLDKETSGLLVVAKDEAARGALQGQFKRGEVKKIYLALVEGRLEPQRGVIDAPIGRDPRKRRRMAVVPGGREAVTEYQVREYLGDYTFLEAMPRTGRTHQIRVHLAFIGHPVAGDPLYGFRRQRLGLKRQFLHSHILGVRSPTTGQQMEFMAELPQDLKMILEGLQTKKGG